MEDRKRYFFVSYKYEYYSSVPQRTEYGNICFSYCGYPSVEFIKSEILLTGEPIDAVVILVYEEWSKEKFDGFRGNND